MLATARTRFSIVLLHLPVHDLIYRATLIRFSSWKGSAVEELMRETVGVTGSAKYR